MNKNKIGLAAISILTAIGAGNAASPLLKTYDNYGNENYIAGSKSKAPAKTGWYAGLGGAANFVSWTYNADGVDSEAHSGRQFGGSLFVGGQMAKSWRGEVEFGLTGTYADKSTFNANDGLYFSQRAYFAAFNAIYDTPQENWGGFYAGGGLGLAVVGTEFNDANSASASSFSPMGQILFGYQKDITDALTAHVGFKGGAYYGARQDYGSGVQFGLGMIWNAGAAFGVRYKF
jgi:hypothetical protein